MAFSTTSNICLDQYWLWHFSRMSSAAPGALYYPITFLLFSSAESKGPGKLGHIVADTLLPMMFLGLRKLGNICCGHKMFLNKIRSIFCVPDTKFVSATNFARAGKRGSICVGNNVSSFARALIALFKNAGSSLQRPIYTVRLCRIREA